MSERHLLSRWRHRNSFLSLQILLSILFVLLVLTVGSILAILDYWRAREIANTASSELFEHLGREMSLQVNAVYTPISQVVSILTKQDLIRDKNLDQRLRNLTAWAEVLNNNSALTELFVGFENGDFFLLRNINPLTKNILGANIPPGAVFMVQSISKTEGRQEEGKFIFLTKDLHTIVTYNRPDYVYDPRRRQWYKHAIATTQQIQTTPDYFFSTKELGFTLAQRSPDSGSVVGAHISIAHLSSMLNTLKAPPSAELVLVDGTGGTLAHRKTNVTAPIDIFSTKGKLFQLEQLDGEQFPMLAQKMQENIFNQPISTAIGKRKWLSRIMPLNLYNSAIYLVISLPNDELLIEQKAMLRDGLLSTFILLSASIVLAYFIAWRLGLPLRRLAHEAAAISNFDFAQPANIGSRIREVDLLASAINEMRSTIRHFSEISSALAAEQNYDQLLARILTETMSIAQSNAGALYLLDSDGKQVEPHIVKWTNDDNQDLSAAFDMQSPGTQQHAIEQPLNSGRLSSEIIRFDDARLTVWFGNSPVALTAQTYMLVSIPLKNHSEQIIGVILLLGEIKESDAQSHRFSFLEALSGMAAISIENKQLINDQKKLLDAFIQVVADAIDTKSPYTGGHCQRVPELTKMLAQAACDAQEGPFKQFNLSTKEWEAVHIASWLHDCGKMTTPEYVVDKATKLETIYDRIHEIRMRFEVLKRERTITYLEALLNGENHQLAQQSLHQDLATLDEEFSFVASCNEGGEYMAPEKIQRLHSISRRQWMRSLDDRIGLSWEELQRKNRLPPATLPTQEFLLDDREDHKIEQSGADLLAPGNAWDFKMEIPELRYNRGEIYNLSISRGTLTKEERYRINDHIVRTIIMLNRLPFSQHLKNVPEIAGGHHEKMNGTGYPKRLKKEEMSPLARMMAIADIFEALTCVDRPYKKSKKLSEVLVIMIRMKTEEHIDPEIFDLFLQSGVYLRYAQKYMTAEQLDLEEVEQLLA